MTFSDLGISTPSGASGQVKVLCPQCSHKRKKFREPCLSVNMDDGTYNCHNSSCGWSGSLKKKGDYSVKTYRRPTPPMPQKDASEMDTFFKARKLWSPAAYSGLVGYLSIPFSR